ncbi:AAA ATPase domain-containing protein [Micromonospora phaseoli]|uniref:AAA ATPase domain-containing protein n=1 Tax=Micromonospora phaseoli TaxID=1144548 RepID=A0A1H7E1P2_9ACTN|nr:AAA ATPase-like protein [Micromonospora phaseoli]GIJ80558.1 hypothetical protein Xph01_49900 [Micromonospora phaseoli]SEK05460.1 AAA ATPase domain-containing protein [Micromonospora phaseoli]
MLAGLLGTLPGGTTGAAGQANTGGTNIANSGVIERLTVALSAAHPQPSTTAFVCYPESDRDWVEQTLLVALDPLPMQLFYSGGHLHQPDDWEMVYAVMDKAALLVVVGRDSSVVRDRRVRDQVAYWLDNHPDRSGLVLLGQPDNWPEAIDRRLAGMPVVAVGEVAATDRLVRAVRLTPRAEPIAARDQAADEDVLAPVREAYLRWVQRTHSGIDSVIAGVPVTMSLAQCPPPGPLVRDGSTGRARVTELDHLRSRARQTAGGGGPTPNSDAEFAALADRPLPTYLSSARSIDRLDLAGLPDLSPDQLAGTVWRAIVLGEPGSGKSSMVRRLAHDTAARQLADDGERDVLRRLPVLCRAADLAVGLAGAEESAEGLAALAIQLGWAGAAPADPASGDRLPPDELARMARVALRSRRLVLIVDGLDEVPTLADRRSMAAALDVFAASGGARLDHPVRARGNQTIITSRIAGYYAAALNERFEQLLIGPLDRDGGSAVIDFWLGGYFAAANVPEGSQAARRTEIDQVISGGGAAVGQLAANPYLLVSLISAVLSGLAGRPGTRRDRWLRADLYTAMVEYAVRRGGLRFPDTSVDTLIRLQAAVAYQIHDVSRSGLVDRPTLIELCDRALGLLGEPVPPAVAEQVDVVIAGIDLLTDRGQGLYGFRHLTVQEYFAGRWLIDADTVDAVVAGISDRLGDPRWLEAVRLALGQLSRASESVFTSVLDVLLAGPGRRLAAEMLSHSLADVAGLRRQHLRALVRVAVETEAELTGAVDTLHPDGARMLEPLLRWTANVEGDTPPRLICEALCEHLRDPAPATMVAAARLIDALRLDDRSVVQALLQAQYRDGADHGWQVTRALLTVLHRRMTATGGGDPEAVRAGLDAPQQALVDAMVSVVPSTAGAGGGRRRAGIRSTTTIGVRNQMRTALTSEASLRDRVRGDIGWLRLVLCLYGGIPFLDMIHWLRRRDEAVSVFSAPTSEPAERYRAAVLLDTLIEPAIAARGPQPVAFRPEQIAVDSPLTDRLLAWLRAAVPGTDLPDLLAELLADRQLDPEARGDALAAWLVLDIGEQSAPLMAPAGDPTEDTATVEAVRRRARWRLGRTEMLLGDALAGLGPLAAGARPAGDEAGAAELSRDTFTDVVRALWVVGHPRVDGGTTIGRYLPEELALLVCGFSDDKEYGTAVMLDVAGRDIAAAAGGLASAVARVAQTESVVAAGTDDWLLDPLSPPTGDLAEALTVLAGLHPRWGFLRCWFLDRLAEQIIAAGFRTEAACLAMEVLVTDPTSARRTLERLGAAGSAEPAGEGAADSPDQHDMAEDVEQSAGDAPLVGDGLPGDPTALARLDRRNGQPGSGYPALRAQIRLAALLGDRWTVRTLDRALGGLTDGHQRLRAIELAVQERLVAPGPDLLERAVTAARQLDDPAARASALARTARWMDQEAEESLLREALVALRDAPPDEIARVLSVLPPLTGDETQALRRRCEAMLTSRRERSIARGDAAGALLSHENLGRDADATQGWAALTTAVLCRRGLDLLRDTISRFTSERTAWSALSDAELRPAALAALLARAAAGVTPLRLDEPAAAGIDAIVAAQQVADAVDLLAAGRASARLTSLRRWREHPHADLSGVATLLAIESGELDPPAVARLPELLSSADDRVRLRTRTAIASVSRGGQGPPKLRASTLGAATVVELVRLVCATRERHHNLYSDLSWALTDVVHDSPVVLRSALELLSQEPEGRRRLLVTLGHLRLPVFDMLLAELPRLSDEEQVRALWALRGVAWSPSRFGMEAPRLRRAVAPARQCVNESGDEAAAEALRLLGQILPVTALSLDSLLGEALSGDVLAEAACDGLGFLLHRVPWEAPQLDTTEAVAELWMLARDPGDSIAVAALTALARAGVTIEDDGVIAPDLVLRGLVGAVDPFLIGDPWLADLRRAARFVLRGVPAGDSAPLAAPDPLLALLLDRVVEQLSSLLEASSSWRSDMAADYLSVLYAVATQQPAALREAVAGEPRDVPDLLLTLLRNEPRWHTRSVAGALLAILGDGDAPSLRALLDLAWDTDSVGERVLGSFRWLDRVTEAGLAELVRAAADPFAARAYFAVQMLAALAKQGALGPEEQRTALAAVAGVVRRPDATRQVLLERDGRISSLGSLADASRQAVAWLESDRRSRETEAAHTGLVLPASGIGGEPVTLRLTGDVPTAEPIHYQVEYLRQTENIELPTLLAQQLGELTGAAATAAVPLRALLPSVTAGRPNTEHGSSWLAGRRAQGGPPAAEATSGVREDESSKLALLLILGVNMAGDEIYSYLRVTEQQIEDVRAALATGAPFTPADFGTVVISGQDKPSPEVTELVGVPDFLIHFNKPSPAAPGGTSPAGEAHPTDPAGND